MVIVYDSLLSYFVNDPGTLAILQALAALRHKEFSRARDYLTRYENLFFGQVYPRLDPDDIHHQLAMNMVLTKNVGVPGDLPLYVEGALVQPGTPEHDKAMEEIASLIRQEIDGAAEENGVALT